jgi:hypothetical protein
MLVLLIVVPKASGTTRRFSLAMGTRGARRRAGAELIALGRAGASVEVAGAAADICRHYS